MKEKRKTPHLHYEIQVRMLEIYNEKIQDLLVPINKRFTSGIEVREHNIYGDGVYQGGLTG